MQQIKTILKNSFGIANSRFNQHPVAIKDDIVYIIEANPRASRTVPFIAKAYEGM
jgi:carbamoyl-phosphate synthase large subunit